MTDVQTHMRVQDAIETAILDRGVEPPADLADIVFAAARAALESAPPSLRVELAEAKAEIARLTEELSYASDPFNWEAMWTGEEAMGWAITHGNYIQIGEEQGQVFMRMRAVAAVEEGQKT